MPEEKPKTVGINHRTSMIYEYTVRGTGPFPMDMLRHDQAWPATSADAAYIEFMIVTKSDGVRSIMLHSFRTPTVKRWERHHWKVIV